MKQLVLSTTILLMSFVVASAQDFDYDISRPYRVIDAKVKEYFHKDGQVLAVKVDGKRLFIQKWDAETMKETSRKEYEDFPKGFVFESIKEFNNKYYMFYSLWDKPNKTEQLIVRKIDFESGKFEGKAKRIIKVKNKITNAFGAGGGMNWMSWSKGVTGKFNIERSFDESKVLIQYRKKPETRNDDRSHDIIGFYVFDDNMEEIHGSEIKMPYTEAKMNNLDYSVDSKGNTYVLSMVYKDDTQKLKGKKGQVNYRIELLRINAGTKDIAKTPIKVKDYFLNKVSLFNQADDQMICAGFYTKTRNLGNADGVVMFKINENGEVTDGATYEIPLEILNMYQSKRAQKKNKKKEKKGKAEFAELTMRKLIVGDDGSILLVGEQYYVIAHTSSSSRGVSSTRYTYHYNSMLVTKIDKNGELAWMKKLGKTQTGSAGRGGMSFEYFNNNDSHYFMFLDNIKNLDLQPDERPAGHKDGAGGFFMAYKIDHELGDVSKVALFDTRDVKGIDVFQFQVSRIVQSSDAEFMVEVYKKKKEDIWIKVKVKD